jgi:two-component system, NarL family, nitrate/nitrite response regulator NarL
VKTPRIVIVEDHMLFAEAMGALLQQNGFEVVGIGGTASEGLEIVLQHAPDVVLLDIGLPDGSGIEVGTRIMEALPETSLIALTATGERETVRTALRVGFRGYLTKQTPLPRLISTINAALAGETVIGREVAAQMADSARPAQGAELLIRQLTHRELEVLRMLAEGATGIEIAHQMSISRHTVRTHIQNLLSKLGVHSRLEAVAFALRHGLLSAPGDPAHRIRES